MEDFQYAYTDERILERTQVFLTSGGIDDFLFLGLRLYRRQVLPAEAKESTSFLTMCNNRKGNGSNRSNQEETKDDTSSS